MICKSTSVCSLWATSTKCDEILRITLRKKDEVGCILRSVILPYPGANHRTIISRNPRDKRAGDRLVIQGRGMQIQSG